MLFILLLLVFIARCSLHNMNDNINTNTDTNNTSDHRPVCASFVVDTQMPRVLSLTEAACQVTVRSGQVRRGTQEGNTFEFVL